MVQETASSALIEKERQRTQGAWRYVTDPQFHAAASLARRLLEAGDHEGFLAVLDRLAGSDFARIESLIADLEMASKMRPSVIVVESAGG